MFLPRVEVLRPSTLGYEIATPTELPGVRTVHGAYHLVIMIGLKHANEPYSVLHQGNRGESKTLVYNWFVLSPLREQKRGFPRSLTQAAATLTELRFPSPGLRA